ncbi:MAG: hypothetical protein Q8O12_04900 [Candidatus Omnitrophota bacterium]|nr:hypothetical protein [Candidatus Omnitrophota bacterium]
MKSQEKIDDLFDSQAADKKIRRKTRFLLPDVKNSITISYETMIFYIIGFVMACIIVFSLGVEKGRYDEKERRLTAAQQSAQNIQREVKQEPKKGVSNVAASKPKNIKSR